MTGMRHNVFIKNKGLEGGLNNGRIRNRGENQAFRGH